MPDLDWTRVRLHTIPASRLKPRVGETSSVALHKLAVIARIQKRSIAGLMAEAVNEFVDRQWPKNLSELQTMGATLGMTPESLFEKLSSDELLKGSRTLPVGTESDA